MAKIKTDEIRRFKTTDRVHADLFNNMLEDLINNDKEIARSLEIKNFVLLASNWSNTAPFTQEVAVAGVKSSDSSVVGLDTSNHINNAQYVRLMKKAWSCVDRIESLEGKIRAYCANKKPVADIYLTAKGV
jgi:hypothetical protein|nr:MAG TPA: hypothetical protein [Caudoviricetes sp.]DAO80803.1 MAG TPA: hypothetical protein [Caudoviricetes sp.]